MKALVVLSSLFVTSGILNLYQTWQISNYKQLTEVLNQKDSFLQSGYDEVIVSMLKENRETTLETIRSQGRLEGVLSVVNNFKPTENLSSEIWHSAYHRGLEQKKYTDEMLVKSDNDYSK